MLIMDLSFHALIKTQGREQFVMNYQSWKKDWELQLPKCKLEIAKLKMSLNYHLSFFTPTFNCHMILKTAILKTTAARSQYFIVSESLECKSSNVGEHCSPTLDVWGISCKIQLLSGHQQYFENTYLSNILMILIRHNSKCYIPSRYCSMLA